MEQEKQTTEVRETSETDGNSSVHRTSVTREQPTSGVIIFQRIVWYVIGLIIILLAMRLILQLLGANDSAPFVNFIYTVSNIFAAPFYGIFGYQPTYGKSYLEVSTVIGILVYAIVGWGVARLATITRPHEEV